MLAPESLLQEVGERVSDRIVRAFEEVFQRLIRGEVLFPDLGGSCSALDRVLAVRPDVLNHNLETVPRLYPDVRPGADYRRSLSLLAYAKSRGGRTATKSGLMLGLGEGRAEGLTVFSRHGRVTGYPSFDVAGERGQPS